MRNFIGWAEPSETQPKSISNTIKNHKIRAKKDAHLARIRHTGSGYTRGPLGN